MKKNDDVGLFHCRSGIKKILLPMKLIGFFVCVCVLHVQASSFAQVGKVTFQQKELSVEQVFDVITTQLKYDIFYSDDHLDVKRMVQFPALTMGVEDVLKRILGDKYCWRNVGQIIVIYESKELPQVKGIRLKGVVYDEHKNPLPGVTVRVAGTTIGTATDGAGKFSLELVEKKGVLDFSFIGFRDERVAFNQSNDSIRVIMHEEAAQIEEVVITGYQNIDRRKNTSAVTTVKMKDLYIQGASSIDQMLQGRIPDMMFSLNSGEVGVVPKLRIRGTSTLIGNREPLLVLDGIVMQDPVDISPEELNDPDYINRIGNAIAGINPQDIERIDVLKDAAATALYGTRAANGVIVVTTKKGHVGKPVISYNTTVTMRQRPRYSDRSVNVMNSKERIQFSRDLTALHYEYPKNMTIIGYEYWLQKLYSKEISQAEFDMQIAKLETTNTDWFDLLTEDSFSHNHTLSLSGGSETARYYASLGYTRDNDVIKGDHNERYTANLNLNTNLASWLTASFGLTGNVSGRAYYQEELAPMQYAYRTSRAIPAFDDNGEYFYYKKKADDVLLNTFFNYNILNELDNSSYDQEGASVSANVNLQFRFTDWLNANAIVAYTASHTTIEGWWGEKSYHAACLRKTENGVQAEKGDGTGCTLPYGGELSRSESNNRNYTVRLQLNASKYFGEEQQHNISGSAGFEANASRVKSFTSVMRGYFKDRGMSFVKDVDLSVYPAYVEWLSENTPTLRDTKGNTLSAYLSVSYSYFNYFTVNANARVDGSNKFGDQSNDKLLPIWSASANWNLAEHSWMQYDWLDFLSLKASFGYQGNMPTDQSPIMIIKKGALNDHFSEYISTIERYPNPDLKWEKTTSYNLGLDFSLFKSKLQVEASYYWKHTENAFMNKTIASMNGVRNSTYIVNGGDLDNHGYSVSLTVSPINNEDFRWSLSTSFSRTFNKLESNPAADQYEKEDFLDGRALVKGKAVGTFYSFKFLGLSPVDGGPIFDDGGDNKTVLQKLNKYDFYTRILQASGRRDPTMSGNLNTSVRWKNIHFSGVFAYSLGNKVRLFSMYNGADAVMDVRGIYPENNVSKDLLKRWQYPGDELRTDIPAIISLSNPAYGKYERHWSSNPKYKEMPPIASTSWDMYDYGNHRVVSGNYLKCSNLSLTYEFDEKILSRLRVSRLALTVSAMNLFTISAKELKGQTPTQSGFSTIQLSERPTYSVGLNVSF